MKRAADSSDRRTTRAAYTALGWVVLFFAFHTYWHLGGAHGKSGKLPSWPHSLAAWIFTGLSHKDATGLADPSASVAIRFSAEARPGRKHRRWIVFGRWNQQSRSASSLR